MRKKFVEKNKEKNNKKYKEEKKEDKKDEKKEEEEDKENDGEFIIRLYRAKIQQIKIVRTNGFKKQKVNYWVQKYEKGIKNKVKRKKNKRRRFRIYDRISQK